MKQLENIFRTFFLLLAVLSVLFCTPVSAREPSALDSIEIGLITCTPHEEIYSLYGHTALRYHDLQTGEDMVFNYGVFNYNQPYFVMRFVFGKTDYELGIASFKGFCEYYRDWGSQVTEQLLDLRPEEKRNIAMALETNWRPEYRVYRYNFFYDNCATRPRDIIERNVLGRVVYQPRTDFTPSYRDMIHQHTRLHPWAAFGNDLLLGVKSDQPTTQRQQHFLPENLQYDFDRAQIVDPDGTTRPLVKERRIIVEPGIQVVEQDFPLSPLTCAVILLGLSLAVAAIEWHRKRTYRWWDALLMLATGLTGCVIVVMFFSEHPTTSTNLQVLLFNPLPLFHLRAVIRRQPTRYWQLSLVCFLLFMAGSLWQDYAEGMEILALCLLVRVIINKMKFNTKPQK